MINTDLQNELLKINSEWKSNSRIYGEVIEMWVENNVPCKCGGKFINQPANQKSIDCICDKCLKNIQIKSSSKPFKVNKNEKLRILGAEYMTTLKSINKDDDWDLMLVHYNKELNKVEDLKIIESQFISAKNVIPRKPLGPNARRAGWQGCYLEFPSEVITEII
jgi:type II restriction enzyme